MHPSSTAITYIPCVLYKRAHTQLLIVAVLISENTLSAAAPPLASNDIARPLGERKAPVPRDEHTADHIDDLDQERKEAVAVLRHR